MPILRLKCVSTSDFFFVRSDFSRKKSSVEDCLKIILLLYDCTYLYSGKFTSLSKTFLWEHAITKKGLWAIQWNRKCSQFLCSYTFFKKLVLYQKMHCCCNRMSVVRPYRRIHQSRCNDLKCIYGITFRFRYTQCRNTCKNAIKVSRFEQYWRL